MGKARKTQQISAPSGTARGVAKSLKRIYSSALTEATAAVGAGAAPALAAQVITNITESFCLALFLPCWMYPRFKQLVQRELALLVPVAEPSSTILPPAVVVAKPLAAPPPLRSPASLLLWGWPNGRWQDGGPELRLNLPRPWGSEFVDPKFKGRFPPGSRFFENVCVGPGQVPYGRMNTDQCNAWHAGDWSKIR